MSNELVGAEVIEVQPPRTETALESVTRGEVDMQVSTARRFPRSITKAKQDAMSLATLDQEVAEACFYSLKRGGKSIEGPGVRLAEIMASSWGNLRCEARVVSEDDRFVVAQGTCWDMERNVLVRTEVRRRITGSDGRKYTDDMIGVTSNAAASIAFRNAVFKVIPSALTNTVYLAAKKAAVGDVATLDVRRTKAVEWFKKAGATEAQVIGYLGKAAVGDIDISDLEQLTGLKTAIQEGTTSLDAAFAQVVTELPEGRMGFGKKKQAQAEEVSK